MKKQFLVNGLIYFICIFAALLLNLIATGIALKIVDMVIEMTFFSIALTRIVTAFLLLGGVMCAVGYFEEHKEMSVNFPLCALSFAVAYIINLGLALLFGFHPFIAGGSKYLAGLLRFGGEFTDADLFRNVPLFFYIAAFTIYIILIFALFLLCAVIGKNKRISDRKELMGNNA